jgi:hypothetical protein
MTHQLLVYDDANLLDEYTSTKKRKQRSSLRASKKVGLEVNAVRMKYMLKSSECRMKS